ncbi:AcrR family transcriptional regulator [Actinoalloteichus hymeniacidonis]|uniref:Transcriptional regulator, TetR family n=1 Tax=Actinoalloteichus hymeniacidonis TaxID=340345 RepID=A0AAC9MYK1_9PSEU|nr:TetR/AcrR family transcriptional regulator [Actinoalloteichus hymeniacidonis]AOS64438.1 transcriptional regulator, TetR family [Actinoalloteichus hymeniacidonis]MBB5907492.1 AcrR family transcriptional regulator [Actinoalloteichus hymeniacidonis]
MADEDNGGNPGVADARRRERAHRILDAAGELILRWGYDKTTIDDVARLAGVAKGTIYLHWNTREALFTALLRRERAFLAEAISAPESTHGDLRAVIEHIAAALGRRPLLEAVMRRDLDILGRLRHSDDARTGGSGPPGFAGYLERLREAKLIRTDLTPAAQLTMVSATFLGFLMVTPLMPAGFAVSAAESNGLLGDVVHRSLAPESPLDDAQQRSFRRITDAYLGEVGESARTAYRSAMGFDREEGAR